MTGPDYPNLERVIPGPEYPPIKELDELIAAYEAAGVQPGKAEWLTLEALRRRRAELSPPIHPRRDGVLIGIAVLVIAVLAIVAAASRGAPEPTPQSPSETAVGREGNTQALLGAPHRPHCCRAGGSGLTHGDGAGLGGAPPTVDRYRGTATWYCLSGSSACTRGYGPGDLVAAIDTDLGFAKGDQLVVRYHDRSVTVTVVDTCGCPGDRLIDLTSGAFRRLAPLGQGVLPVTVELAGATPTLPATDITPEDHYAPD